MSGWCDDLSISSSPNLPLILKPNETLDVNVTFSPSLVGTCSGTIEIISDDPDELRVEVSLTGTGVRTEIPPEQEIENILDFFDESVENGSLVGSGPGQSGNNRLNALRNMIEAAGDLVEAGDISGACTQLLDAYRKTDGQPRPPDFVTGEAASELAAMIQQLMETLGCE